MPGAVPMIQRNDKLACFEALGALDPEKKTPMRKDAIFRIYSMSKPITTAAADVKVGEEKPDKTLDLVAPRRPMTIQDLMRHTSGLAYGFFGEGAVKKAYLAANLEAGDPSTAELVERLALTSRARLGTTAMPPTCLPASSRWWRVKLCPRRLARCCLSRSA